MAHGCCKDSVAIDVAKLLRPPTDGLEIPCRWCDGYARYESGQWVYHTPLNDRVNMQSALAKHRAQRVKEALK